MPASRKPAESFEERLQRLEQIAAALRSDRTALEEAAALFDEGITLARGLEKELSRLERKVEVLVNQPVIEQQDEPELELFDDEEPV